MKNLSKFKPTTAALDGIAYRNLSADVSRYGGGGGQSALDNPATAVGPFHYGSHYSNTGVVLHYLLRLPPFTSMFLEYQDGHFDLADRVFHNLDKAWCLASGESSSDVKELIPDMFYLPGLGAQTFFSLPSFPESNFRLCWRVMNLLVH